MTPASTTTRSEFDRAQAEAATYPDAVVVMGPLQPSDPDVLIVVGPYALVSHEAAARRRFLPAQRPSDSMSVAFVGGALGVPLWGWVGGAVALGLVGWGVSRLWRRR